jgi:hypothetical protein
MYDFGRGVQQDYAEAVKWYREAAAQGDVEAQGLLGSMYEQGHGVAQDYAEAVKWYRKTSGQGDVYGQLQLGEMYRDGKGVPQDNVFAHMWLNLAGAHSEQTALFLADVARDDRDNLAAKMTPDQSPRRNGWRGNGSRRSSGLPRLWKTRSAARFVQFLGGRGGKVRADPPSSMPHSLISSGVSQWT